MVRGIKGVWIALLVSASLAWTQKPSEADAQAGIERSRQKSLDYTRSLPDFECTEVVRRYMDPRLRGLFIPMDKLTIKLSYFQQAEDHQLLLIDDKPTDRKFDSLGGATGIGEFGSTLRGIFDPTSQTEFHWESWKNVRKHRVAVYTYAVVPEHSHYLMVTGSKGSPQQAIVGFHGVLDIDLDTGEVLHYTYLADHIPHALGLDYALTTVDYNFADVGGRDYLLPSRSATEMRGPRVSVKNDMEFQAYRKFSSDSTISFGDGK